MILRPQTMGGSPLGDMAVQLPREHCPVDRGIRFSRVRIFTASENLLSSTER
jgi:hypothetical protein